MEAIAIGTRTDVVRDDRAVVHLHCLLSRLQQQERNGIADMKRKHTYCMGSGKNVWNAKASLGSPLPSSLT